MTLKKFTAAAAATLIMAAQTAMISYAEGTSISPVYNEFDRNSVNGTVIVEIPENVTADVNILFTSPEVTNEPYYSESLSGGSSYSFDIEGQDNTDEDYRTYTLSVELTGGIYGITSSAYTDVFTVPDGNDNPDSFKELRYIFTSSGNQSKDDWSVISEEGNVKHIEVYLDSVTLGDVNNDGFVDADDASYVLTEYSKLSTGKPTEFTSREIAAADVNNDGLTDADDASKILSYYSALSTGGTPSWN